MFSSLKQRSSAASSVVTSLVGWNGLGIIALLLLGYRLPVLPVVGVLTAIALAQVILLRLLFFQLQMHRGVPIGGVWGLVTGGVLTWLALKLLVNAVVPAAMGLLVAGAVTGLAVGLFLSYFHRDDQGIEAEQASGDGPVDYGRDAHWLEPFAYGAISYLLVFLPAEFNLGVYVFIVGAMSGVYAAGASHFSPDRLKRRIAIILLISGVVGGIQGGLSGFLFRQYAGMLWQSPFLLGALGGFVTYLWTLLRGRELARQSEAG